MKILLLGSGALKIGQAGEFDYSGSQAIKALKEEGHIVVLINPNIATIQTSQGFADTVYFLPLEDNFVKAVIEKEKPNAIILSFGGQTALNCGLSLSKKGILEKYNVKVLGTPTSVIETTEDRQLFANTLKKISISIPKSISAKSQREAKSAALKIGFPLMIRSGFSLGGQDSGLVSNLKELEDLAAKALAKSSQILVEEYLWGWKEIEYEVVRDKYDNCITVCNMENIDPMGIHTGESVVVAPSQTLNNFEYHKLREISIKVIRHLGIIGECNIQFALNPTPKSGDITGRAPTNAQSATLTKHNVRTLNLRALVGGKVMAGPDSNQLDYRVIEVNARLSRSSALASKATGYPLAYVATKLILGKGLTEIKNSVTKTTIAAFEPAMDYVVVKFPRWDLTKFVKSETEIGSSMQSVGEVMAIGRKLEEALQKASRMLDIGMEGVCDEKSPSQDYKKPTPWRIFSIAKSIKAGESVQKISKITGIDQFFLFKIKNIVELEKIASSAKTIDADLLLELKQHGFSDKRISQITKTSQEKISNLRAKYHIYPSVKQIDTLAAEYPAKTNYLYLTYNGTKDDIETESGNLQGVAQQAGLPTAHRLPNKLQSINNLYMKRTLAGGKVVTGPRREDKVIILGSGPYRIGSSVEFDWCSVTCAQTAAKNNVAPIIINCNPETVSTDYDMAQKLYFDELSEETVLEIYKKENPLGVIVSMGGQKPNNLTPFLTEQKVKILGTSSASIDMAEDRNKFSKLCDQLGIDQPPWAALKTVKDAIKFAENIVYPVLVRPSYVLSGAAMNVAFNSIDLKEYLTLAANISDKYPVVISKFMENAKELEIDAVAKNGKILTLAISEHVENAGVHSGDSTIVLPAQKLYLETYNKVEEISKQISQSLQITGPFNIQFLAIHNEIKVIECNLRASRSLPFVSKITGVNFAKVATEAILNTKNSSHFYKTNTLNYVGVKAPQFSFSRIKGADPILRVEMASTGEVACFGKDIYEAFLKSVIATGIHLPKKSVFISLAGEENKVKFLKSAQIINSLGLKIYATVGTSAFLKKHGIQNQKLYKIYEIKKPNVLNVLHSKKVDLVINIIDPYFKKEFDDDYQIRRTTVDFGIPLLTNLQTAELFVASISQKKQKDLEILPWDKYVTFRN